MSRLHVGRSRVRFPAVATDFLFKKRSRPVMERRGGGAHPATYSLSTGSSFPLPCHEADHSTPARIQVKKE